MLLVSLQHGNYQVWLIYALFSIEIVIMILEIVVVFQKLKELKLWEPFGDMDLILFDIGDRIIHYEIENRILKYTVQYLLYEGRLKSL